MAIRGVARQFEPPRKHNGIHLTPAEQEILVLAKTGISNKEIANQRGCSVNTVKYHLAVIFQKTNVSRRAQLAANHVSFEVRPILRSPDSVERFEVRYMGSAVFTGTKQELVVLRKEITRLIPLEQDVH
jgi:DNA-binding CsgD family transcriptional regulator